MTGIEFKTSPSGTGVIVKGVNDQYADGKMAKVYKAFIGDENARTENYKRFLIDLLRKKGCKRILDVACGTGIDSIMLLEEGFDVVSTDGSDKMLKYAYEQRWERRREPAFENWIIREANWLEVYDTVEDLVGDGFDAVICFGSSFAHLLDSYGDQREQKQAISNFEKCLKRGGLLLIDHRNYEKLIKGQAPKKCVFYDANYITNITTSVLSVMGKPALIIRDYIVVSDETSDKTNGVKKYKSETPTTTELRLMFHPHMVNDFRNMLKDIFGEKSSFHTLGDFKNLGEVEDPTFYIHIVEKQ
ncbi:glycine N-methyltransferase [Tribolium castaneum]|uniref:Glycine N-methyltransferase n=1 Tax=Tribolium castaneum TaxID=7070 RepID=D6WKI7_TRICA|nr:PREDICTED: glycine N-methyltransferase [Tribolium castaneum]EFA04003.1 Glycine N-methyltransferase-like Protein [Tribolium castaneum]|eukprot:XP_973564.1 PREDICTED: glycine N-methyltransferase [Tribolium castaneum]